MFRNVTDNQRLRTIVIETLIALAVFSTDPLGLAEQKFRAIGTGLAVATQYFQRDPPEKLAVLLIDQPTLDDWGVDWPISYGKSAELVHALACARATGVFFDFTTSRKFNLTEGADDLQRTVENSAPDGSLCVDDRPPDRIPVFFGRLDGVESPMNSFLKEHDAGFLLNEGEPDGVYWSGKEEFPARALTDEEVTPAFGLIRKAPFSSGRLADDGAPCGESGDPRPKCWSAPLALAWTAKLDPLQSKISDVGKCRGNRGVFGLLWGLTPLGGADRFESCPPVLTLRGMDLYRDFGFIRRNGDPSAALAGRFVFVGVDLPALNDRITTPVHDHLPGVYKHAVALGELLAAGKDYPTVPRREIVVLLAGAIYLVLEAVREFSAERVRRHLWFAAAFGASVAGFTAVVVAWHWPLTLVLEVFGYYASVAFALFLARQTAYQSRSRTARRAYSPRNYRP